MRTIARLGLALLTAFLLSAPALATSSAKDSPCSGDEHRAFDFWVGTWEVRAASRPGAPPSTNVIRSVHDGCALHESYGTPGGYEGSSLTFYDAARGVWHQTWIDNQGRALYLEGGPSKGGMMLASRPEDGAWQRITWTRVDEDTVRQHWESSSDGGSTWTTVFDGVYTRHP